MLEGMIDVVVSEVEYGSGDWREAMRATVISAHDCLTRHPWAAGIWNSHWPGPIRFGHMEWILTTLTEAGFSDEIVYHAFHAIELHIVGFAMQAQQFAEADLSNGGDEGTIERFFERVPESDFPNLVHHVREHLRDDHVDEFEFILDLTLDGLERLRDR